MSRRVAVVVKFVLLRSSVNLSFVPAGLENFDKPVFCPASDANLVDQQQPVPVADASLVLLWPFGILPAVAQRKPRGL
jgi:hypothetical protein